MGRQFVQKGAVLLVAGLLAVGPVTPAMAVDLAGPSVPVTATVASSLSFSVTIVEILSGGTLGATVTSMNFGTLASNGTFDPDGTGPLPPQPRSLNSTKAFQAFLGINAQQRPFTIKHTASALQNGANRIADGAFIVTPLEGIGGDPLKPLPGNITRGTRRSAIGSGIVLFTSTAGPAATMAATYGITDDPNLGATEFIPLDQPAGTYTTNVVFTATVT